MDSLPWWMISALWLASSAAIWGVVLWYTLRQRTGKPKAAHLILFALGIEVLQWLARLAEIFEVAYWTDPIEFTDQGHPNWASLHVIYTVLMQLFHAACGIAGWSLLAWAALMRPDETTRRS